MPPLPLTSLLQTALPDVSPRGRAVLSTLACTNGHTGRASEVAAWVGLRSRYQLNRVLRRDGLPPLEELAGWARVIYWITQAEKSGTSLLTLARREAIHASAAYRLVRRITGCRWAEIRRMGLTTVLRRLRDSRREPPPSPPRLATIDPRPARTAIALPSDPLGSSPRAHGGRRPTLRGELGARITTDEYPFDVAVTPTGLALVTCGHAAVLDVISLRGFRRLGSIPVGGAPTRVRVSRDGEWAYVTSQFAEEVGIVDLRAGRQVGAVSVTGHALGAALARDGRTLYVTTNTDRLYAVSLRQKRVVASVPIPMGSPQISIHPAGHRVYVSGYKTGSVTECDASTLRTVRTFELGGITQDIEITESGELFVANQAGWLDVVALANGRHISRLEIGSAALGLALRPDQSALLVSLVFDGFVYVIDPRTLQVQTKVKAGGKPRLMSFDPSGLTALVANECGWVDQLL